MLLPVMTLSIHDIFLNQPITGVTINTVFLPPALRTIVYLVIAAVVTGGTAIFFMVKKRLFRHALTNAVITALFAAGLLYAVHADIGWAEWLKKDYQALSGRTTEEKLLTVAGPLYKFSQQARRVVPADYTIANDSSGNYLARRFEYFMLPVRKRADAAYIVVLADNEAKLDLAKRTFSRAGKTISDIEPVLLFAPDTYIVRKP